MPNNDNNITNEENERNIVMLKETLVIREDPGTLTEVQEDP
jgi:hypothetical protein